MVSLFVSVVLIGSVSSVDAQTRNRRVGTANPVPDTGMWAVGGSIGAAGPADDSLDTGFQLVGNAERYFTPRVSIRGQLGASWFDVKNRHFTGTVTPLFVDGNVVYNWEGGAFHPFVTGGIGMYRFHSSYPGTQDRNDTNFGVNVGGGMEFFLNRYATLTTELDYHKVGDVVTPLATYNDGSFWRFGVGLKKYWR